MGEWQKVTAQDGQELVSYIARPQGPARGGLVVVQEIFGVNEHMRNVADSYAAEGYLAIAPSLFDRIEPGVQLTYQGEDVSKAFALYGRLEPQTALLDVAAAFQLLQTQVTRVAVLGFCYGGLMAWLAATRGPQLGFEPACTVGYYPGGVGNFATEEPTCPVLLHFGSEDSHIGADQIEAVQKAHPEVSVHLYGGAGHAFNRLPDPGSYRPVAAQEARQHTLAFLRQHLDA